jgi:hypothetical protein
MAERLSLFIRDDNASHELSMSEREQPYYFESQKPFSLRPMSEDSQIVLKGTLLKVPLARLSQETSA